MKASLVILIFSLLTTMLVHAQNQSRLVAHSIYTHNPRYMIADSGTYTYTGNHGGDPAHTINYSTFTNLWYDTTSHQFINGTLSQQTFDTNDNIATLLNQTFDTVTRKWVNEEKYSWGYDNNHNDTSEIIQYWDAVNSIWVNNIHQYSTFNNNLETTSLRQKWDDQNKRWTNDVKSFISYGAGNKYTKQVGAAWNTITLKWDSVVQNLDFYDAALNDTLSIAQLYDSTKQVWVNNAKYVNIFDAANNNILSINLYWNYIYSAWDSTDKEILWYDANNNDTTNLSQFYDDPGWSDHGKVIYTYNGNNQETSAQSWDLDSIGVPTPWRKDFYYYETYNGIKPVTADDEQMQLYPNPSSTYVHLHLVLGSEQPITLSLCDLQGRRVWQADMGAGKRIEANVPVNNLANGMYLLRITTGYLTQTRQIVVSK